MAKALKKPRRKAQNNYRMPEPLPKGEILTDMSKHQWKLGTSIGKGGFGEIYSAQEASKASTKYPYVIKVEPHENGPLFVEMHFYMKNARQADIDAFKKKHKLQTFGMPSYIGSGSHEIAGIKYRFIVMEKFGSDLDKLRQENGGFLPPATVFQIAWQMIYILEYIHQFGYVHADIKGANILIGITAETKNQAYLVDFGLATKYSTDKVFKPNPKKAHDGTIEYLSRDAHQGVSTRRGDLEILAYNMIIWLGGNLPWGSELDDPNAVQKMKEDCMGNIPQFLKRCFANSEVTFDGLSTFLKLINNIKFNEEPNYKKIRDIFKTEIEKCGKTIGSMLEFNTARKRRSKEERETPEKKPKENTMEDNKKNNVRQRKEKKKKDAEEITSDEVLTDAMKEILAKRNKKTVKEKKTKTEILPNLEGYTSEMIELKVKKMNKEKTSKAKKKDMNDDLPKGTRSRRNLPVVNYDERNPNLSKN